MSYLPFFKSSRLTVTADEDIFPGFDENRKDRFPSDPEI